MGLWDKLRSGGSSAASSDPPKRSRFVWSRNMHLRVAAPVGDGWEVMEAGPSGDGLLAAFRCMRGEPPDAVALNAYAYAVAPEHRKSVEQLCAQDWPARWLGTTFAEIDAVAVGSPTRAGVERGCEVQIDGRGRASGGPLRVRERHVPAGERLLVASAAGPPALLERFASLVDVWLTSTTLGN
jgi:hypothetical protein